MHAAMVFKRIIVCLAVITYSEGRTLDTVIDLSSRQKRDVDMFRINSFSINSVESLRFAKVDIMSSVENLASEDKEFNFNIRIPKSAFISAFVLKIGDVETRATVAEKAEAQRLYTSAKEQNVTAGFVTQQTRISDDKDRDIFAISVNIAKATTVEFRLQYYEFLERHAGIYTQSFYIFPRNTVRSLQLVCDYTERQNFTRFSYKVPFEDTNSVSVQKRSSDDGYYVRRLEWLPDLLEEELDDKNGNAFEISFELEPLENGGHVIYNEDGDFAHYFSSVCDSTQILSKKIIFVIDISGSMAGAAIEQVKIAIGTILDQLRSTDYFNLILFENDVFLYQSNFVSANDEGIALTKAFVEKRVVAGGSTNMNEALVTAATQFDIENPSHNLKYVQTIVFLTDGSPTSGVVNKDRIRANLRSANYIDGSKCCKSSVFTIAFSKSPDIQFLRKLTDDHLGSLRVIRESLGSEISKELVGLYREIHNPYYRNVQFSFYSDGEEIPDDDITQSYFLQYDCGEELVVGGQTKPGTIVSPRVQVEGAKENLEFKAIPTLPSREVNSEMLTRLVAYKKVKDLLKTATSSTNKTLIAQCRENALEISLKMEFVTELTSLIVTLFPPSRPRPGPAPVHDTNTRGSFSNTGRGFSNSKFDGIGDYDQYDDTYNNLNVENLEKFPNNGYRIYAAKFMIHILFYLTQVL